MHNAMLKLLERLARLQTDRPLLVVLLITLTLVPALLSARQLELRTSFSELLPDDKPSVVELRRIEGRLAGQSTLTIVAEGGSVAKLKRFIDELTPKVVGLGPSWVTRVDTGTREARAFFKQHAALYADLEDLTEIHEAVVSRYDEQVAEQAGFDLGLDDDEDEDSNKPPATVKQLEERLRKKAQSAESADPGVDGYYIDAKQKLAAMLVRTPLRSGSDKAQALQARIRQLVQQLSPDAAEGLRVNFTGNLVTSAEQHRTVADDLAHVGLWGVGLILGIVFLFFLRFRTLLAMALTIAVGCSWAFAFAQISIGHLNTATGFLFSIIAGNGINFGIIYMARYIEARRDEHQSVNAAVLVAHRETYGATLAAAAAAMVAYGSLAATDFRGFKHFGVIGGSGMLLCWLATYLLLPAILVLTERARPMFGSEPGWRQGLRGVYGYPFAWLARRWPRTIAVAGVALGVVASVVAVRYLINDPMEYNLRNVRNDAISPTSAARLSHSVDGIVGRLGQDGKAVLVERLAQVEPLVSELRQRQTAAPEHEKPFSKVVSIFDLLPEAQTEKLELLEEIRDRVERAKKRNAISNEDYERITGYVPSKLKALAITDLPELVARPFTEANGTRGTIVYIAPTKGRSVYDAHYLMRWADSFREVRLPDGSIVRGTGDPVIFSDMLLNVEEDAPRAILLSLLGTILVILIAFRGRSLGWLALGCLVVGIAWLVAFLAIRNIHLNFLNFVALPISIGVGADYAINVLKRRQLAGDKQLYRVFIETGGAVVLCSLTTTLGYLALLLSINRAVRSFGLAAAIGEITTLAAAMLLLPALLFWQARRRTQGQPPSNSAASELPSQGD